MSTNIFWISQKLLLDSLSSLKSFKARLYMKADFYLVGDLSTDHSTLEIFCSLLVYLKDVKANIVGTSIIEFHADAIALAEKSN